MSTPDLRRWAIEQVLQCGLAATLPDACAKADYLIAYVQDGVAPSLADLAAGIKPRGGE